MTELHGRAEWDDVVAHARQRYVTGMLIDQQRLMQATLDALHCCSFDCSADAASWPEPKPHHDLDSPAWHYFHE